MDVELFAVEGLRFPAAHWDQPQNIACVISGRRRYTLFPTEQIKHLYIGPLDRTPAGAPVSLVDFEQPDFGRFPLFREALAHAEVAELAFDCVGTGGGTAAGPVRRDRPLGGHRTAPGRPA